MSTFIEYSYFEDQTEQELARLSKEMDVEVEWDLIRDMLGHQLQVSVIIDKTKLGLSRVIADDLLRYEHAVQHFLYGVHQEMERAIKQVRAGEGLQGAVSEPAGKVRYEYGTRRRADGKIVQMPLTRIRYLFRTTNMSYVYGEIYRRPFGSPLPWERYQ